MFPERIIFSYFLALLARNARFRPSLAPVARNIQTTLASLRLTHCKMKGKTAECANLIRSGANVNTCDLNEICPLAAATTTGSVETVELLIKMKAIIDFKDRIGHTPLIKVIICVFVLVLVCVGGMIACPQNAGSCANNAANEIFDRLSVRFQFLTTLVVVIVCFLKAQAAARGHVECVYFLWDKGADPYAKDSYGYLN